MNVQQERAWILSRGYSERFNRRVEQMPPAQVHAIFMRLRTTPDKVTELPDPEYTTQKSTSYYQPTLF